MPPTATLSRIGFSVARIPGNSVSVFAYLTIKRPPATRKIISRSFLYRYKKPNPKKTRRFKPTRNLSARTLTTISKRIHSYRVPLFLEIRAL